MPIIPLLLAGGLAVAFSVLMLFRATLYASAICFLVVLAQVAVIYLLLGAELLAFLQVLVYAGAIMVLVVTAVMATPPRLAGLWARLDLPRPVVWMVLALPFLELAAFARLGGRLEPALPAWPTLQADFAGALFGRYALLTEGAALLLLLSALAVVEAWGPGRPPLGPGR